MVSDSTLRASALPSAWPQAPDITQDCGPYQMRIVLAAHGLSVPIRCLQPTAWARGYTFPWRIPSLLKKWGGLAARTHVRVGRSALRAVARDTLLRGRPLIVLIRATRGKHGVHWVSIWGYDEMRDACLVYDSQYENRVGGIGNIVYDTGLLSQHLPGRILVAIEVRL